MGWKIGAPSLKLNNAGTVSKHCGDFGSVAREALAEREGRDPDIDQTRADLNRIEGFRTAAELQEYSAKHLDELRDAKGRKLRKDAVVMCATILKPPAAMMNKLSIEDQRLFLDDASAAFAEIVGAGNIKSRADHFDELGAHSHVFWEPMTEDGRLCAKEVHNLQFFSRVNRELPEKLRAKGWDIDDCEMYDAAKEEYEKEQKKKSGRPSVAYKLDAEKEKAKLQEELAVLQDEIAAAKTVTADMQTIEEEHGPIRKTITGKEVYRAEDAEFVRKAAGTSFAVSYDIDQANKKIMALEDDLAALEHRFTMLQKEKARLDRLSRKREKEYDGLLGLIERFLNFFNLAERWRQWVAEERQREAIKEEEHNLAIHIYEELWKGR